MVQTIVETLPSWWCQLFPERGIDTVEQYFRYREFILRAEYLIIRADEASSHSLSYRPFPVGCAVHGTRPEWRAPAVYTGHNMKVASGDTRVICGEVIAIGSARQAGCTSIPLIAVVGPPQPDHGSGHESCTLHPCYRCRAEFVALAEVADDTIIITATHEAACLLEADTPPFPDVAPLIAEGHIRQAAHLIDAFGDTFVTLDMLIANGIAEVMTCRQLLAFHQTT